MGNVRPGQHEAAGVDTGIGSIDVGEQFLQEQLRSMTVAVQACYALIDRRAVLLFE